MTHDTSAYCGTKREETKNICLSLRTGNMRRRDEEAARDVGAMRINGWNVGLSFVWLFVWLSKSIAFRSVHFRYYCYDRVQSFRNVAQRLESGGLRFYNSSDCLYRDERRIVGDENVEYRSDHSIAPRHLSTTADRGFPDLSDEARYKLVKNGTDGKRTPTRVASRRVESRRVASRTEFPFARCS